MSRQGHSCVVPPDDETTSHKTLLWCITYAVFPLSELDAVGAQLLQHAQFVEKWEDLRRLNCAGSFDIISGEGCLQLLLALLRDANGFLIILWIQGTRSENTPGHSSILESYSTSLQDAISTKSAREQCENDFKPMLM
eukprot:6196931-Pleurochrysis_carterae.AAC.1